MEDPDFLTYLDSFSCVCLLETFVDKIELTCLDLFVQYVAPAKKISTKGRMSGGLLCLVKRDIADFFRRIDCGTDSVLMFRVDGTLFGSMRDILMFFVYVPPKGSPFYDTVEETDGISILEKCISEGTNAHPDCAVLILGDLNARTGNLNTNDNCNIFDMTTDLTNDTRRSQDFSTNEFGHSLIALCSAYDLSILNGSFGEESGKFTYVSQSGSSVIDYCIASKDFLGAISSLRVAEDIISPHMPLELTFAVDSSHQQKKDPTPSKKIIWDINLNDEYIHRVRECLGQNHLKKFSEAEMGINTYTSMLTQCYVQPAEFLEKTFYGRPKRRGNDWFNKECTDARKAARKQLRTFLKTTLEIDKDNYLLSRNKYKQLIRTKKREHRLRESTALTENIRDSTKFWRQVKKLGYVYREPCNISLQTWCTHFKNVFTLDDTSHVHIHQSIVSSIGNLPFDSSDLDTPISQYEVGNALKHLTTKKSCGNDNIMIEMLKSTQNLMVPYLVSLFNAILDTAEYPELWSESIIIPIHKHGSYDNPDNYRGIALMSNLSKVFTHIIGQRLRCWAEQWDLIREEQAGFRRGYGTIDHIFALHSIAEKYLYKHRKLYVGFVDFRKAFDTVKRNVLWRILEESGVRGKLLNVLKAMYGNVRYCVRTLEGRTEAFESTMGLKQGCKISPIMFSYLINVLAKEVSENCKHSIQLSPNTPPVSCLLFADDVALLADSPVGLQNQIDQLKCAADKLGLIINTDKSKVVVYRMGGHLSKYEKWSVGGIPLQVVSEYRYLGNILSTKLCTNVTQKDIAHRAKVAIILLIKALRKVSHVTPQIFYKLFDAQIMPILLYGSEVWGTKGCRIIESVHLYALKNFLNVSRRTPNDMVYGETGRFPVFINAQIRVVRYWLKILKMDENRLPKRAYRMMMCTSHNWAERTKQILIDCDLGDAWNSQRVSDENSFLKTLREKLLYKFKMGWERRIASSERYTFYREFKCLWKVEQYLYEIDKKVFRDAFIRFRLGISELHTHSQRYNIGAEEMLCPLCRENFESEIHFLLKCPALHDLRDCYILKLIDFSCTNPVKSVMDSSQKHVIRSVSLFLHKAFVRRRQAISSPERNSFYTE